MVDDTQDESIKKNKKTGAREDAPAREDLHQFTVLQDTQEQDLTARDMEASPAEVGVEDAVSKGPLAGTDASSDVVIDNDDAPLLQAEDILEDASEDASEETFDQDSPEKDPDDDDEPDDDEPDDDDPLGGHDVDIGDAGEGDDNSDNNYTPEGGMG